MVLIRVENIDIYSNDNNVIWLKPLKIKNPLFDSNEHIMPSGSLIATILNREFTWKIPRILKIVSTKGCIGHKVLQIFIELWEIM